MPRLKTALVVALATALGLIGAVSVSGSAQAATRSPMVIKNMQTDRCLSSNSAGTVHSNPCSGSDNQIWDRTLDGDSNSTLRNRATGRYLQAHANETVTTQPRSGSAAQKWRISHSPHEGYWRIKNLGNGKCLSNYGSSDPRTTRTLTCGPSTFDAWKIN